MHPKKPCLARLIPLPICDGYYIPHLWSNSPTLDQISKIIKLLKFKATYFLGRIPILIPISPLFFSGTPQSFYSEKPLGPSTNFSADDGWRDGHETLGWSERRAEGHRQAEDLWSRDFSMGKPPICWSFLWAFLAMGNQKNLPTWIVLLVMKHWYTLVSLVGLGCTSTLQNALIWSLNMGSPFMNIFSRPGCLAWFMLRGWIKLIKPIEPCLV